MAERRYTLKEIDYMRAALRREYLYGRGPLPSGSFNIRPYKEADLEVAVEQRLRTYMAAGADPHELAAEIGGTLWVSPTTGNVNSTSTRCIPTDELS